MNMHIALKSPTNKHQAKSQICMYIKAIYKNAKYNYFKIFQTR